MQEKIRLLMEETGCEQGEAELALELADNDLEKAIRTIESLLRHIYALKGKFFFTLKNLYGFLMVVVNKKTQEILRLRMVVSYNPALYENSPSMDWYALEKLIFSYRLDEGSLPDFTQEIEQKMQAYLVSRRDILVRCDTAEMGNLFNEFFSPDKVNISLVVEELNLAQFRQMPSNDSAPSAKVAAPENEPGAVWLQVDFVEDKNGREASRLVEGEVVLSQITDTRDIAHYLAHLIGGRREGELIPMPAVIKKLSAGKDESEAHVYYAPGIMGIAHLKSEFRVRVLETKTQPWWKKIIPWN